MRHYKSLVESINRNVKGEFSIRRYSLSEIISESYKAFYACEDGSNLKMLAEAHLQDVRNNPTDIDRLSKQLCNLNRLISMIESNEIKDKDLLVPKEKYSKVVPDEKKVDESKDDEDVSEEDDENLLDESKDDEDVEETDDENLLDESEDTDLTDEEVEELTKHLQEIRKNKKVSECDAPKKSVKETMKPRKLKKSPINLKRSFSECDAPKVKESEEEKVSEGYSVLNLVEFSKKSNGKAFVKTFKKLDSKLKEGTALTRQESISLYKATNSAMTHLSVELEHNPDFLETFKESVSLLSVDVNKLLNSLKEGKAPSKSTMKSLSKFVEALLREDEEEEELPPIEDEDDEFISDEEGDMSSEEEEDFDQEYADARVELHKEMAEEHEDTEDPGVQDKLAQDAEEVANLPGITDEQLAELEGEEPEEEPEIEEAADESEEEDDGEITDEELAALKKHLQEMRKSKR